MPEFEVDVYYTGCYSITVTADTVEEARELAGQEADKALWDHEITMEEDRIEVYEVEE